MRDKALKVKDLGEERECKIASWNAGRAAARVLYALPSSAVRIRSASAFIAGRQQEQNGLSKLLVIPGRLQMGKPEVVSRLVGKSRKINISTAENGGCKYTARIYANHHTVKSGSGSYCGRDGAGNYI